MPSSSVTGRHLENIDFNKDGGVMFVSSNLTGEIWDGGLNYFPSITDIDTGILQAHLSKQMFVGVADGVWFDSTHVVVATDEGNVEVLSLEDRFFVDPCEVIQHHSYVTTVAVTCDSQKCISGSADHLVSTGDLTENRLLHKYQVHADVVNQVSTHNSSPDMFASCSMDGSVFIWDLRSSTPAKRITATGDIVTAVCYHDDKLALGTERGELLVKDLRVNGVNPLKSVTNHNRAVRRIKFSPERSELLATGGEDGVVAVVDYNLLNTHCVYTNNDHTDFVSGIAWAPVDRVISCSWDSTIKTHDISASSSPTVSNDMAVTNGIC